MGYFNRKCNVNNMWFLMNIEYIILSARIEDVKFPEDPSVEAWIGDVMLDYNLEWYSHPSDGDDVPLLDLDNLIDETREFVENMKKSRDNIMDLLGNLPSIESIKAQQEQNKPESLLWTDKLSTKEGMLARLCIGQVGLDGWTGMAIMDNTWLMTIITPFGILTEPALEVWKDPGELLEQFVKKHFVL